MIAVEARRHTNVAAFATYCTATRPRSLTGHSGNRQAGVYRRGDARDPSRKSSTPFAVTYEAATLPSGRVKLLSSG